MHSHPPPGHPARNLSVALHAALSHHIPSVTVSCGSPFSTGPPDAATSLAQTLAHFPPEIRCSSALVSLLPPQRIFLKHITLQAKTHQCPSLALESHPSFRAGQDEVAYPSASENCISSALHKQLYEVDALLYPHFKLEKLKVQRGSDGWHSK